MCATFLQNPLSSTAPLHRWGVWCTQGTRSTLENVILRGRLKNRAYNRKPLAATAIPHGVHSAFPFKDQAPQVQCSAKKVKCPSSFQNLIWGSCALPMFTMPVLRRILKHSSARAECPPQIKAGIEAGFKHAKKKAPISANGGGTPCAFLINAIKGHMWTLWFSL